MKNIKFKKLIVIATLMALPRSICVSAMENEIKNINEIKDENKNEIIDLTSNTNQVTTIVNKLKNELNRYDRMYWYERFENDYFKNSINDYETLIENWKFLSKEQKEIVNNHFKAFAGETITRFKGYYFVGYYTPGAFYEFPILKNPNNYKEKFDWRYGFMNLKEYDRIFDKKIINIYTTNQNWTNWTEPIVREYAHSLDVDEIANERKSSDRYRYNPITLHKRYENIENKEDIKKQLMEKFEDRAKRFINFAAKNDENDISTANGMKKRLKDIRKILDKNKINFSYWDRINFYNYEKAMNTVLDRFPELVYKCIEYKRKELKDFLKKF